eukprot:9228660-Pyramimonas_sp.AAC.1
MESSMPRNEAQSYVGGRPLGHKRPRTNARYLSPLSQPTLESGGRETNPKGGFINKVNPQAGCVASTLLCKRLLLRRPQTMLSGQPDKDIDVLNHA